MPGAEIGRISQEAIDLAALCVQVLVTMSERHGAENVWNALFADGSNARGHVLTQSEAEGQ